MAALTASAMVAVGASGAVAQDDHAETTARLIERLAPNQGSTGAIKAIGENFTATHGETNIQVPTNPDGAITFSDAELSLGLSLPAELDVASADVADDGTVVYKSNTPDGADVAVQAMDTGDVRVQTIAPNADAPTEYTYDFGAGVTPEIADDGTVGLIRESNGESVVVGVVAAPWATDANGRTVETSYQVVNDDLVQTIHPDADAEYPIVADPKITLGKNIYVNFTKAETKKLEAKTSYAALGAGICAMVPSWLGVGCATFIGGNAISLDKTFQKAVKNGTCVQIAVAYGVGPLDGNWRQIEWKTIKCLS